MASIATNQANAHDTGEEYEEDIPESEYETSYWGRRLCQPKNYWYWWLTVAVPHAHDSVPDAG